MGTTVPGRKCELVKRYFWDELYAYNWYVYRSACIDWLIWAPLDIWPLIISYRTMVDDYSLLHSSVTVTLALYWHGNHKRGTESNRALSQCHGHPSQGQAIRSGALSGQRQRSFLTVWFDGFWVWVRVRVLCNVSHNRFCNPKHNITTPTLIQT